MKKVLFGMAVCATVFAGCQEEATESLPKDYSKFTATFEDGGSRVILDSEDYASWEKNDKVSVFNESGTHYTYTADKDGRETTLSGPADATFTNDIFALFPYKEDNSYTNRTLVSELATEQVYGDAMNHAIMVARIPVDETNFVFKNSCALVKININTTSELANRVKINSINIKSQSLSLSGTVTIGSDYTANISKGAANSVVLTGCSAAGLLGTDYQSFLLVIPAGTYPEGDLKITIDTNQEADYVETTDLDYIATLPKAYTVGRSQYIELKTTLKNNKTVEKIDKAIMADNDNLFKQGFYNQYEVPTEYEIPDGDFTIDGNGKVYNFSRTKNNIAVINTFTTNQSGIKDVTAPTITVKNLTITGTLRSTHLGIWEREGLTGTNVDDKNNKTIFENVNVVNNKIILWTDTEGSAVATFGEATFNNCVIKGAEWEDPNTSAPIYDLSVRNYSHAYLNGGEFGICQGKEHSKMTISGDAIVEYLFYIGIQNGGGVLTVEQGTVKHLLIKPNVQNSVGYYPVVKILAGATIPKLEFVGVGNWKGIQIDPAANVTEIYVDGAKFEGTLAEFIAAKSITTPTATE